MRRTILPVLATGALLAAPAAAQAHVTLQPPEAPAGSYVRMDVRVPNERDDAGTTRVVVRLPDGFASASTEPVPGWTARVAMEEAPEPIELHGEEVTEQVDTVTFVGDGEQGIVAPGQFQDFGLSVRTPDAEPGTALEFPSVQTYEGGEVVRWIGPEDSDEPAPVVTLTAADEAHGASAADAAEEVDAAPAAATTPGDDGGSDSLSVVALIVGALGLAAGLAGLLAGRRARTAASSHRVATQP